MGIRGLNSLFNANPDLSMSYELHDTRVVFDGYNLVNFLYFNYKVPCRYAGDYDRYAEVVKEYFSSYLQCNITPVIIFDGGHDKTDRKLEKIIERTNTRLDLVHRIASRASESEEVLPIFASNVFIDVIKELNIAHAQSSFEADGPITSTANHYQCPVISLDSDFYIFDIRYGFIRSDYVDTTVCIGRTRSGRQYKYLSCRIYTIDHFLSFFQRQGQKRIHKRVLPLFGTLLGNDFVDVSAFENFFLSGEFSRVTSKKLKLNERQERIVGLLEWLKMYDGVNDAIEDVLGYLPEEQRRPIRKMVKQAVETYKISEPYLLKYIDPVPTASNLRPATPSEALSTYDGKPLPPWFVNNFHKANISSYLINVVGLRRMILPTQVENTAFSSSHNCSFTVRQILYGLLLALDGLSKDSARAKYVEEYDRLENQLERKHVKPIMVLGRYGPLPNLSQRQLNTEEGKLLVLYALGEQNTNVNDLPDSLQLLVINIRYWLRTCTPKPTVCFFDALLLTVLYLLIGKPQSSDAMNITTDDYKKFSPKYFETASVLDVMRDVLPASAAYFGNKFQRYCQQPSQDRRNLIDMTTIHGYSQLQGCIFYSLLINEVTGRPFSTPKLQLTFNGSLIYNMTSKLRTQSSPESFIKQTLGPRSALEYLFSKLKNKILENLPKDCLRE